ncbi:hypothetical protein P7K49_002052 [Saguinus oedipus]|uniref:Uncharacterized protein n=1 Tax=Saguinus oedipus TaxID=9490 RepID=A0ABQ9WH67_SAGOE|nr:hypothetical protein P7K49_002052 [Saguinus oedipus]
MVGSGACPPDLALQGPHPELPESSLARPSGPCPATPKGMQAPVCPRLAPEAQLPHPMLSLPVPQAQGPAQSSAQPLHSSLLFRTIGDRMGEAKASGNLGNTLKVLGRFDEAAVCCQRHLSIAQEQGDKVGAGPGLAPPNPALPASRSGVGAGGSHSTHPAPHGRDDREAGPLDPT